MSKRDEVAGELRRLHNEELHALYSSPNVIRELKSRREFGRACSTYWGEERCIQGFSGELEGTRPLGRPRGRWEYNTEMDLREVG